MALMEENTSGKQDQRKPEKWDIMEGFPTEIIERIEAECFQIVILDRIVSTFHDADDYHIKQWSRIYDEYFFSAVDAYLPYFQNGQSESGLILALQYYRHCFHSDQQDVDQKIYFKHYVITVLKLLYPNTNSAYHVRMHREHPFLQHLVQKLSDEFI